MPDDRARQEFAVDLAEAEKAVADSLPAAAEYIRAPIGTLTAHEGFGAALGHSPAANSAQTVYAGFTDYLAGRLSRTAEVTEATADALADILALYRRADGQG
ncbi:hypothetical protein [Actinokineospora sp.]|uniref:hypothetical protein n=1 Tax=Actinokineospora sp. TaxID=1872133 RepID=UPI004038295C